MAGRELGPKQADTACLHNSSRDALRLSVFITSLCCY